MSVLSLSALVGVLIVAAVQAQFPTFPPGPTWPPGPNPPPGPPGPGPNPNPPPGPGPNPPSSGSGSGSQQSQSNGGPTALPYWLAQWNSNTCDEYGAHAQWNVTHLTTVCHNLKLPNGKTISFNVTDCEYPSYYGMVMWNGPNCQGDGSENYGFDDGACTGTMWNLFGYQPKDYTWKIYCWNNTAGHF